MVLPKSVIYRHLEKKEHYFVLAQLQTRNQRNCTLLQLPTVHANKEKQKALIFVPCGTAVG